MTIPTSDPSVTTPDDHLSFLKKLLSDYTGATDDQFDYKYDYDNWWIAVNSIIYLTQHFNQMSKDIQSLRDERDKLRQQNITLLNQLTELNEKPLI